MIGPGDNPFETPFPPTGGDDENRAAVAAWHERERRHRSVRMVIMFMMMMMLMDGEERNSQLRSVDQNNVRKRNNKLILLKKGIDNAVYSSRREEDQAIRAAAEGHDRYKHLLDLNGGEDVEKKVNEWVVQDINDLEANSLSLNELAKVGRKMDNGDQDQAVAMMNPVMAAAIKQLDTVIKEDEEGDKKVYHYPRNTTGYYRGSWERVRNDGQKKDGEGKEEPKTTESKEAHKVTVIDERSVEKKMKNIAAEKGENIGVFLLPDGLTFDTKITGENSTNTQASEDAKMKNERKNIRKIDSRPLLLQMMLQKPESSLVSNQSDKPGTTLSHDSGRSAFQLIARPVPGMSELSVIEGFVKMYDGTSGFSTKNDILLRVRGVVLHSLGRVSMVSNAPGRSALVIGGNVAPVLSKPKPPTVDGSTVKKEKNRDVEEDEIEKKTRRRLQDSLYEALSFRPRDQQIFQDDAAPTNGVTLQKLINQIREDVFALQSLESMAEEGNQWNRDDAEGNWVLQSFDADNSFPHDEEELTSSPFTHGSGQSIIGNTMSSSWLKSIVSGHRRLSDTTLEHVDEKVDVTTDGKLNQKEGGGELKSELSKTSHKVKKDSTEKPTPDSDLRSLSKTPSHSTTLDSGKGKLKSVATADLPPVSLSKNGSKTLEKLSKSSTSKSTIPNLDVFSFPYAHDTKENSIKSSITLAKRPIPPRERLLEANADHCEFELNFDVKEDQWRIADWRRMTGRHIREILDLQPASSNAQDTHSKRESKSPLSPETEAHLVRVPYTASGRAENLHRSGKSNDEPMVMGLTGTIVSVNCDFESTINVTAIRTDWEHTTGKAFNYSFYMMLACLTQIVVLLRQLLHTQAQSAAARVSLLMVGWQTQLDALMCISHILLCLGMPPLFTAFISVAFFKLLIFFVIEMKYMAIIIQARNASDGIQTTTAMLRRQVTIVQMKIYIFLMAVFLSFWYIQDRHRTPFMLLLYSFWVPQIVRNIFTEAKKPLHTYYIYGMSVTRLVAPIYVFAVPNNFLKEVNPDFPTDFRMVQLLILWIGVQTAILIAQGKFGARFMIPAMFLPPKFDYSRPIPPSLLPEPEPISRNEQPPALESTSSNELESPASRASTTRNRMKGSRSQNTSAGNGMIMTETPITITHERPTVECVICYNEIDVDNRRDYMLGPCDHLFHRECLEQWMEVKMECPICRTELPAL
eukprot:CAMPEP_0198282782 /NCGR_PEP_ID=MMETSP1449-20131203/2534_1 /TAXON_ID=420275 /ORGANISM="Attheya septentrionalis, Strain CCMP2084" /LENGTH=1199 /DNA_ID=CAMNT_0043979177 /DNA_START=504 /DNA_END=4106 /DNA_ORIENTATION=+